MRKTSFQRVIFHVAKESWRDPQLQGQRRFFCVRVELHKLEMQEPWLLCGILDHSVNRLLTHWALVLRKRSDV